MSTFNQAAVSNQQNGAARTILVSGIIAGVLDATAGVIVYFIFKGLNPIQVLQYIASGIAGTNAFKGGLVMAALGLVLHFAIAFAFSVAFFVVFPWLKLLHKNIWVTGLLYGLFIWLVMNLLVLPNSNIPKSPKDVVSLIEVGWHMALVGLPIAIVTANNFQKNKQ